MVNLVRRIEGWRDWLRGGSFYSILDALTNIERKVNKMATKIAQFAERQTAFNARLDKAVDNITADVQFLKAKIEELQNSPGEISPEDQALLDQLDARASSLADKVEALDNLTPPPPPPVEEPPAGGGEEGGDTETPPEGEANT